MTWKNHRDSEKAHQQDVTGVALEHSLCFDNSVKKEIRDVVGTIFSHYGSSRSTVQIMRRLFGRPMFLCAIQGHLVPTVDPNIFSHKLVPRI